MSMMVRTVIEVAVQMLRWPYQVLFLVRLGGVRAVALELRLWGSRDETIRSGICDEVIDQLSRIRLVMTVARRNQQEAIRIGRRCLRKPHRKRHRLVRQHLLFLLLSRSVLQRRQPQTSLTRYGAIHFHLPFLQGLQHRL